MWVQTSSSVQPSKARSSAREEAGGGLLGVGLALSVRTASLPYPLVGLQVENAVFFQGADGGVQGLLADAGHL